MPRQSKKRTLLPALTGCEENQVKDVSTSPPLEKKPLLDEKEEYQLIGKWHLSATCILEVYKITATIMQFYLKRFRFDNGLFEQISMDTETFLCLMIDAKYYDIYFAPGKYLDKVHISYGLYLKAWNNFITLSHDQNFQNGKFTLSPSQWNRLTGPIQAQILEKIPDLQNYTLCRYSHTNDSQKLCIRCSYDSAEHSN